MKKWFNIRLYADALRQLRLIGWMAFIIYMLEAILIPLFYVIEYAESKTFPEETALSMHPFMLTVFWVVAPLMVLYLFGFMNKRNASDFYHAIPDTRESLFLSMTAAVLTWCLFLVVSGFLIAVLFRLCFGYLFLGSLQILDILKYITVLFAGSVFMTGITLLAMCLTGTSFTNILVAFMLLFVPRSLISIVSSNVYDILPFVVNSGQNVLTNWEYNIPLGLFALLFNGSNRIWGEAPSILYSLLVGLVLLGCAMLCFRIRKSESAGQSALNRPLQTVFRLIFPALISISVTIMLFAEYARITNTNTNPPTVGDLFGYFIFYLLAVVVYLLYELITTRKWKNVLKSIPALGLLVVINLVALFSANTMFERELYFRPTAGEITEVRYEANRYATRYVDYCMNNVTLRNSELNDALAKAITEQTEVWEKSRTEYYRNYTDNVLTFKLRDRNGRIWGREIDVDGATSNLLMESIYNDQALRDKLIYLPDATSVYVGDYDNDRAAFELYDILREELAQKNFETVYNLLQYPYDKASPITMHVNVRVEDGSTKSLYFALSPEEFPRTFTAFFEKNKDVILEAQKKITTHLENTYHAETDYVYTYVAAYDQNGKETYLANLTGGWEIDSAGFDEVWAQLSHCTSETVGQLPVAGDRLLAVNVDYGKRSQDGGGYDVSDKFAGFVQAYFVLTEEAYQKLTAESNKIPVTDITSVS